MANMNMSSQSSLKSGVDKYLSEFPGKLICARQLWYEGLGGQGTLSPDELAAVETAIESNPSWVSAGSVRYEKFGTQNSFRRTDEAPKPSRIAVQHMFKLNGLYKEPDGKIIKIVLSEVYNLRCFEVRDGNLTGSMIKIHPTSDRAKALVEIA
ncbi:MAG: hypothetical protein LBC78_01395 [Oscillospiraceae bacterium]|jgi:hypothetical protein|nr:hypothetical protein [Oscillospiraceae bacterium]